VGEGRPHLLPSTTCCQHFTCLQSFSSTTASEASFGEGFFVDNSLKRLLCGQFP
jgi:hypothetical protein